MRKRRHYLYNINVLHEIAAKKKKKYQLGFWEQNRLVQHLQAQGTIPGERGLNNHIRSFLSHF